MTGCSDDSDAAEGVRLEKVAGTLDLNGFSETLNGLSGAGTVDTTAAGAITLSVGNNDAAGLQHVYECAQASQRKAKLLIMISDGLPSDCSVAAMSAPAARS